MGFFSIVAARGICQKATQYLSSDDKPEGNKHEMQHLSDDGQEPRFEYNPGRNFFIRMLVGVGGKTKLRSSLILKLPYRWWIRWVLVFILALIAVLLTPSLLPKWLGFDWHTSSDLCEDREPKLNTIRENVEGMVNLPAANQFMIQANLARACMDKSASAHWSGGSRVLYPTECIPGNVDPGESTTQQEFCIESYTLPLCLDSGLWSIMCKDFTIPKKCKMINVADADSIRQIAELNGERNQHDLSLANSQTKETQVSGTADEKATELVDRLLKQIDIASDLYIVYTMLAIIVGTPVVIYRRDLTYRLLGSAFGLQKVYFVILIIVIMTIYDSAHSIMKDVDFPQMVTNFKNDPCYLDPEFSKSRLEVIRDTCGEVTRHRQQLEVVVSDMTTIYYDASLCGVCSKRGSGVVKNPGLEAGLNAERRAYESGNTTGFMYPGVCDARELGDKTAVPEDSGASFAEAFLGSGILAQILLKAVLAAWVTSLVAYLEPMTMHRGMVEIFGMPPSTPRNDARVLLEVERKSVYRFARDKHLVPLMFWSVLMMWEVSIIVYSMVESYRNAGGDLREELEPPILDSLVYGGTCNFGTGRLTLNSAGAS